MAVSDVDPVFAAHDVVVAYLFGSRAEGTARPTSDHDVAVLFAGRPGFDATVRLEAALTDVYGTAVDVVDLERSLREGGLDDVDAFARRMATPAT